MSKLCDLLTEEIEEPILKYNPIILMDEIHWYGLTPKYPVHGVLAGKRYYYLTQFTKKILRYHVPNGVVTLKFIQYLQTKEYNMAEVNNDSMTPEDFLKAKKTLQTTYISDEGDALELRLMQAENEKLPITSPNEQEDWVRDAKAVAKANAAAIREQLKTKD